MKTVEDYYFNITYDFYNDCIYVKPLNNIYDKVLVNILDQNKNSIYSEIINVDINLTYWFKISIPFTNFDNIFVEISYDNILITKENIRIKTKNDVVIKPIIVRIMNKVGLGDMMWISPSIRKLYEIYGRKVILSSFRENHGQHIQNQNWGNYLYNSYKEFFKNNRYVNYFLDSEDIEDENKYDIFDVYSNNDKFIWIDQKKLMSVPFNFLLKNDELQLDYVPEKFKHIENLPEKYICINPYITGIERTWKKEQWQKLVDYLNELNIYVVSIGKSNYYNLNIKLGINLTGDDNFDMSQTWHIINNSEFFVTFDCGMYILAGTTDTHIILLGWYCDEELHKPKNKDITCVRGDCNLHCATDTNCVFETYGTLKNNSLQLNCFLNIDYSCKPSPENVFEKIKSLNNGTLL